MITFICIVEKNPNKDWLKEIIQHLKYNVHEESAGRLIAEDNKRWIAVSKYLDSEIEYDTSEKLFVKKILQSPQFILVESNSHSLANELISSMEYGNFYIDNDHGMIAPLKQIKEHIESDLDWSTKGV